MWEISHGMGCLDNVDVHACRPGQTHPASLFLLAGKMTDAHLHAFKIVCYPRPLLVLALGQAEQT